MRGNKFCFDLRYLLVVAALAFIYIQMRLFTTQSEYVDRLAAAIEAENHCTSQTRLLIDKISQQQGRVVALEEQMKRQDQECRQLRALVQDLESKGIKKLIGDVQMPVAAVVVMACSRADYLEKTIKSILKYQTSVASKYPLFISQDGSNSDVRKLALSYDQLTYMQADPYWGKKYRLKNMNSLFQCSIIHLDFEPVHTERPGELVAYYKIARHYKWALDQLFHKHNFSRVIILEDDMEIAADFFDYFEAGATLLDRDKSIMAISSWNDNGQRQFVQDPYALYRSDFFPGLGWMLSKSTWSELSPKLKENHRGRQFIRPEVCRTYNFGEHDNYVKHFGDLVKKAKPIHGADAVLKAFNIDGDVRIQYRDQLDFEDIARQFGIFEEWKDGVPRAAYKGIVVFRFQTSRRVFLVAPDSLRQLGVEDN
ncbi:hypothetical protein H5410_009906 [Solanum commersonii]|uniref:Alpha-1,3-mannosyl-glycoprotein 2-beta-N-acetylglucosaminyltransferase n=1 Tax=Solanum commersonii TaxID=4109 RepID=A0A9J6AJ81_SOLCO|nr:hypothetical protein H5410_009906 [Solanum commersonii]